MSIPPNSYVPNSKVYNIPTWFLWNRKKVLCVGMFICCKLHILSFIGIGNTSRDTNCLTRFLINWEAAAGSFWKIKISSSDDPKWTGQRTILLVIGISVCNIHIVYSRTHICLIIIIIKYTVIYGVCTVWVGTSIVMILMRTMVRYAACVRCSGKAVKVKKQNEKEKIDKLLYNI